MSVQAARAAAFRALHVPGAPLVLFNIWDAGSARAVAAARANALAPGGRSVGAAHRYADGQALPFELALANLRRIVAATELPVTIDLESGYGPHPEDVARVIGQAVEAGAVGCNLEDSFPADGSLRPIADAAARVAAARRAAERAGVSAFVNARTDVFFQGPADSHDAAAVNAALDRAQAYADAGADGLFVPGLADERLIASLVERSPLPVNIMAGAATPPLARLAELGVARVSHGPGPYRLAMQAIEAAARTALGA